jgi:hypothetical protein
VAVADDFSPCATANQPSDVIHQMQLLLNVVEDHGTKNAISGISPLSKGKRFLSYHQPSFLYGTETMGIINLGI